MHKLTNSSVNPGKTKATSTILRGPKESMPDGKRPGSVKPVND